jgi:hypothetical protein
MCVWTDTVNPENDKRDDKEKTEDDTNGLQRVVRTGVSEKCFAHIQFMELCQPDNRVYVNATATKILQERGEGPSE